MKLLPISIAVLIASISGTIQADDLQFYLYQQTRPYIYSVGIKAEDGSDRWYQLEWKVFRQGNVETETCDVFYDAVSENFYCPKNDVINIIPINQPYKLIYEDDSLGEEG